MTMHIRVIAPLVEVMTLLLNNNLMVKRERKGQEASKGKLSKSSTCYELLLFVHVLSAFLTCYAFSTSLFILHSFLNK